MYDEYDSTRFLLLPLVVAAFLVGAAFADCLDGVLAMITDAVVTEKKVIDCSIEDCDQVVVAANDGGKWSVRRHGTPKSIVRDLCRMYIAIVAQYKGYRIAT
jgi:hypothetical protein